METEKQKMQTLAGILEESVHSIFFNYNNNLCKNNIFILKYKTGINL